jgi:hypothetical protein
MIRRMNSSKSGTVNAVSHLDSSAQIVTSSGERRLKFSRGEAGESVGLRQMKSGAMIVEDLWETTASLLSI